jgi:hypothetical protein
VSPIFVVETFDVVFAKIRSALHFDEFQRHRVGIG